MPEPEADFKVLYFALFNYVSDAINLLQRVQIMMEQMYIEMGEEETPRPA